MYLYLNQREHAIIGYCHDNERYVCMCVYASECVDVLTTQLVEVLFQVAVRVAVDESTTRNSCVHSKALLSNHERNEDEFISCDLWW